MKDIQATCHLVIGDTIEFMSRSCNFHTGTIVRIREGVDSQGNLVTVQTEYGYRTFYDCVSQYRILSEA